MSKNDALNAVREMGLLKPSDKRIADLFYVGFPISSIAELTGRSRSDVHNVIVSIWFDDKHAQAYQVHRNVAHGRHIKPKRYETSGLIPKRECVKCKTWKPIWEFEPNNKFMSGFDMKCRECTKDDERKYREQKRRTNDG